MNIAISCSDPGDTNYLRGFLDTKKHNFYSLNFNNFPIVVFKSIKNILFKKKIFDKDFLKFIKKKILKWLYWVLVTPRDY